MLICTKLGFCKPSRNHLIKIFFIGIFILFAQCFVYAQQTWIDSLRVILNNTKQTATKLDILIEIAYKYLYLKPDSTIYFSQRAEILAKSLQNREKEAFVIYRKGMGYVSKGDLAIALQFFKESISIAEKINHEKIVELNTEGIGLIYLEMENFELALNYYQEALQFSKELKNYERMAIIFSNLGNINIQLKQFDLAEDYLLKALPLAQLYLPDFQAYILCNLGEIKINREKIDDAEKNINQALIFAKKNQDKQDLAAVYALLAEIAYRRKDLEIALEYAQISLKTANESQIKQKISLSYKICSKVLEATGNKEKALDYYKLFVIYKDSLQSGIIKNALQVFESERKQGEIMMLKMEKKYQQTIIYFFIGIVLLLTFVGILILLSRQKIKKINKNLQIAYFEIKEKQEEILLQNEELNLSKEEIYTLNNHLEALVEERSNKLMKRNKQLTEYAFFNAHKLRSPIATILGLYEVLKLDLSLEERESILDKMKVSIVRLDEMVRQSQQLLDGENEL